MSNDGHDDLDSVNGGPNQAKSGLNSKEQSSGPQDPNQNGSANGNPAGYPLTDHSMDSIHSLLAASQQLAATAHNIQWPTEGGLADAATKRKRDDSPSLENNPSKIRKTQDAPAVPPPVGFAATGAPSISPIPLPHMTTVTCLHAAVAQKSYGTEKRFLCPPPVVRVDTPPNRCVYCRSQQLAMRIFPEIAELQGPPPEQKATLDETMAACFKYLHVGGTAKSKSFHLSLDLAEPPVFDPIAPPPGAPAGEVATARIIKPSSTWASFSSAPVTIISKPSKKTAKTRNLASCILAGGPVSLFNRINSQTVRTKYMTVDQGRLCASNTTWSAFNVEVVQAVTDPNAQPPDMSQYHPGGAPPQPVTYGSTLLLTDSHTGLTSDPLVIRKVDKGRIVMDEGTMGGPVSQMQKVALCRITETGARYYLSAAGPLQILPDPNAPTGSDGKNHVIATHPLVYQPPAIREEMKNDVRVEVDEVDDFLCWTIVGISKFQYTFFDGIHNNALPRFPITPFPTLLSPPIYKPQTHTLELTIANYFYADPHQQTTDQNGYPALGPPQPLEIWLGTLGPLNARVYQNGELSHTIGSISTGPNGAPTGSSIVAHQNARLPSTPAGLQQLASTIVVVEIPPMRDMLRMIEVATGIDLGLGLSAPLQSMAEDKDEKDDDEEIAEDGADKEKKGKGKEKEKTKSPAATAPVYPTYPHPPHIALPVHMPAMTRGIPILFVRTADGVGYHSGREIACENVLGPMGTAPPTIESWAVRVL